MPMMDPSDTLAQVKILEEYHGKPLPPEARVYYVEALASYSPSVLTDAARRWMDQNSPSTRFPSLSQLRACIDESRTTTWARKKTEENRQPISEPVPWSDPEYTKARWAHIRRAFNLTPEELVGEFENMHRQWPGHGWDGAARRLRSQLQAVNPDRAADRTDVRRAS